MRSAAIVVSVLSLVMFPIVSFAKGAETLINRISAFHAVEGMNAPQRFVAQGSGFVIDSSHPQHPGDSQRHELTIRVSIDATKGNAILDFESGGDKPETDRYFVRRGRPFQLDDETKNERDASFLGDLAPSVIPALHPTLVARALVARRENVQVLERGSSAKPSILLFAWNDELWRIHAEERSGRIVELERRVYSDVFGDGAGEIRFEDYRGAMPWRIVVAERNREIAKFELTSSTPGAEPVRLPEERENWHARVITSEDVVLREIAPHLFTIDLVPTNSRVIVAEFSDHVAVVEGAYNSRNCDLLARTIRERLGKPIRYFSFSHLHGQYVGGTRSYVHEGATVLVPPTTVPLIEQVAAARHDLRPDAQSRNPKPARIEVVKEKLNLEDELNALAIYNVGSGHTDEYLIFHFPRQKVLITGDLLFYRGPDRPLRGRSKQLCETIAKLGLDVETMFVSWPLEGYGVHNTVRIDEFRAACERPSP